MPSLKEQLQKMTPEERQLALQAINNPDVLKTLYSEDYWEKPVSIDEFLENDDYLGWATDNGKNIYPYWRERMREIFDEGQDFSEVALTGCLSGDTLIPLLNGKKVRMDELSSIGDLDEYVYSFDVNKNEYVPGHLIKAFSTGIKKVYRIYLDNGKYIDATSNHKFMTRDKHWKSIDTGLSENDSLMPFNTDNINILKIEYLYEQEVYDLTVEKYHNFATECGIVAHNSIGCGKSHIAVICLCYFLYRLMCLKDPASYYNLSKGSPIYIVFLNLSIALSEGVAFSKFNNILLGSPWFMRHGKQSQSLKKPEYIPDGNIRFTAGSQVSHVIGKDCICLAGDTKIVYEGGSCPIGLLEGQKVRVYTMNDDGSVVLTEEPVLIQKTKEVKELIEIELEDNTVIRCTENHRFLTKNKEYKEAKDLTEDDELDERSLSLPGIYRVENKINGKNYVGKSNVDAMARLKRHYKGQKSNKHLQDAIKHYGKENFDFNIVQFFDSENKEEDIIMFERFWINIFDSFVNGYNATSGGEGLSGWKMAEESCKKHGDSLKAFYEENPMSDEQKKEREQKRQRTMESRYGKKEKKSRRKSKEEKEQNKIREAERKSNQAWITDGVHNIYVTKQDIEQGTIDGYSAGRTLDNKAKIGTKKINNGVKEKQVPAQEVDKYLALGWKTGSLRHYTKKVGVNNGVVGKRVTPEEAEELLSQGWEHGYLKKGKKQ